MKQVSVRSTGIFHVKDHPENRKYQFIPLEKTFGFVPEVIMIEKVEGNNKYRVSAIIPEKVLEKMKKEEETIKKDLASKEKSGVS